MAGNDQDTDMKVVTLGGKTILLVEFDEDIPPGADYEVEVTVRPSNAGPGGADCTAMGSCTGFSV